MQYWSMVEYALAQGEFGGCVCVWSVCLRPRESRYSVYPLTPDSVLNVSVHLPAQVSLLCGAQMLQLEDVIASCSAVLTASVLPRLVPTVVALAEIGRLTHTPTSVEALQVPTYPL
jgi:hypothetical protein